MQKDFHFGVTYTVARLAGFEERDAHRIAYSAQFVDDAVHEGILTFKNRASYAFIASAHKMLDYRNFKELANKYVWIPFHFLPGNRIIEEYEGKSSNFEQRLVCRPNSEVAQAMVDNCIKNNDKSFALHLLGVTMHVYADTWAHQGFCGVTSHLNTVGDIYDFEGVRDDQMHEHIKEFYSTGSYLPWWLSFLKTLKVHKLIDIIKSKFVNGINPIGHGSVLSYPDLPFKKWQYKNWNGDLISRDNPDDFYQAVIHMFQVMKRFRGEEDNSEAIKSDFDLIKSILKNNNSENDEIRLTHWLQLLNSGQFSFGQDSVEYKRHGVGSWMFEGLGFLNDEEFSFDELDYPHGFMAKDWKLLHDALAFHRFSVLNVILPKFGISTN